MTKDSVDVYDAFYSGMSQKNLKREKKKKLFSLISKIHTNIRAIPVLNTKINKIDHIKSY